MTCADDNVVTLALSPKEMAARIKLLAPFMLKEVRGGRLLAEIAAEQGFDEREARIAIIAANKVKRRIA